MNTHTKLAIFIAPFLLVGGYIAADYYAGEKLKQKNLFQLTTADTCRLHHHPCVLGNGQLQLQISDDQGMTRIQSSHAIENLAFSIIDPLDKREHPYQFQSLSDASSWQSPTRLTELMSEHASVKLRVIATVNKAYYYSEFKTLK